MNQDELLQEFLDLEPCVADIVILKMIRELQPYSYLRIDADIDGKANSYAVVASQKILLHENKSPLPTKQKIEY